MKDLLDNLFIELVLTAHPTEARRRTVLSKMEYVAHLIEKVGTDSLSLREQEKVIQSLRNEILSLWLTDRVRAAKLTVADEVKTGLYFIDSGFW
ncbi:phosphoenolpyruvate carboxylase, partial [bacterium]|nr:phosphoenolpyruvate carboxylase [bacterium]